MNKIKKQFLYRSDKYLGLRLKELTTVHISRALSSETYFTNERGWRVRSPQDRKATPCDIAIAGSSWTAGTAVNYEDCFVGILEDKLGTKIANLSVGSTSLIQLYRFVEEEIKHIKPRLLVIPYGTWLIDRCLKEACTHIHYRPIFKRNNKSGLLEVISTKSPPDFLGNHYTSIRQKATTPGKVEGRINAYGWPVSTQRTYIKYPRLTTPYLSFIEFIGKLYAGYPIKLLKKVLGLSNYTRLDVNNFNHRYQMLEFCLNKLFHVCAETNTQVMFLSLYEYSGQGFDARKVVIQSDNEQLEKLCKKFNFSYQNYKEMEHIFKTYMSSKGLTMRDYLGHVHWKDNNHPNKQGHKLIADYLYPRIKSELEIISTTREASLCTF